jgi:hypothetical protein
MLCDFSAGVELVSADYLAAWKKGYVAAPLLRRTAHSMRDTHPASVSISPVHSARNPDPPFPADDLLAFETIFAGSWHNHYPGETRIRLDLTRLVSFYDAALAPSLVAYRASAERWEYRLQGISAVDLAAVKTRLRGVLAIDNDISNASGIDWQTLYRVVVDRYADRLETLEYIMSMTSSSNLHERARTIQMHLRIMLTPYIPYNTRPIPRSTADSIPSVDGIIDDAWAGPVWRACATKQTAHIHSSLALHSRLTTSEHLLLRALDGTNREICRVLVRMWAAGVHAGLDPLLPREEDRTSSKLSRTAESWRTDAHALIAWLDWSVWVKCRPACPSEVLFSLHNAIKN